LKNIYSVLACLALLGCGRDANTSERTGATQTGTEASKPTVAISPSSTPATVSPASNPDANVGQKKDGSGAQTTNVDPRTGNDPERINQLKDLKVATIVANGHKVKVWLMDNESKRQEGMMFLRDKDVHADEGMLFLFPSVQPNDGAHGFWMHNCPLGLDICYIGKQKKVLNIADGKPFDETSLPPSGDYQYVLEMKVGCAKKIGVKTGTKIEIADSLKTSA